MNEQPLPASVAAPAGQRVVSSALNFWFRRPPRLHGENNPDRTVSFLELLYDLVFVVLIGQAAYPLAHEPSWRHLAGRFFTRATDVKTDGDVTTSSVR